MNDTTVTKVNSESAPKGPIGQTYLASGKQMSMRLWTEKAGTSDTEHTREYETVGYVIEGSAELRLEGQIVNLKAGDSWVVPSGARHQYRITAPFKAVEAMSPAGEVRDRDES